MFQHLIPSRFRSRTGSAAAPVEEQHACAELDSMPLPFSPLISEMLAMHAHTRQVGWLAERESCRDEFQLAARAVIYQLQQAWEHQTGGRGTIDDLLVPSRPSRQTDFTSPRAPGNPAPWNRNLAS